MAKGRKTGGRQPGSQNKTTSEMKQWLQMIVDKNRDQFESDLQALEPKERLSLLEKLISYLVPKPQSIGLEIEYRYLQKLLSETPEQYIEAVTAKILNLNQISNETE